MLISAMKMRTPNKMTTILNQKVTMIAKMKVRVKAVLNQVWVIVIKCD